MTWVAQVRHVLVKDVHESSRLLLAYAALVAVATGHAVGWTLLSHPMFGASAMLVTLVGAFMVASVVQADSPTRSDAFWASHPLRPSAIAGSKLGFALLLLALGVIGQAIGVRSYDLRGLDAVRQVVGPALVYGALLLAAMVVAALMRDLRSFALAVIAIPVLLIVAIYFVSLPPLAPGVVTALDLLGATAGLAMLGWLYRTRDTRRGTRLVGFFVASSVLLTTSASSAGVLDDGLPTTVEHVPLALELPGNELRTYGSELKLNLRGAAVPEGLRLRLKQAVTVVHLRDGSVIRLPMPPLAVDLGDLDAPAPRVAGIRWIHQPARGAFVRTLAMPLTPAQRRAIDAGVASITLEGRIVVMEAHVLATMPLVAGSEVNEAGRRLRIDSWTHDFGDPAVAIHERTLGSGAGRTDREEWMLNGGIQAALVHPVRGEGLVLQTGGSAGATDGLVLPGTRLWSETFRFGVRAPRDPGKGAPDDAWFQGAQLLVATQVPRGSYPVRLELAMPTED